MSYLLDTNICIHLFKDDEYLIHKIEAAGLGRPSRWRIRFANRISCYLS
jgi:predicted nucleic acid-binding protein